MRCEAEDPIQVKRIYFQKDMKKVKQNAMEFADIAQTSFEEAFAQAQTAVEQLEGGEVSLQESIDLFEKGMRYIAHCSELLNSAELRIELLEKKGGEYTRTAHDVATE